MPNEISGIEGFSDETNSSRDISMDGLEGSLETGYEGGERRENSAVEENERDDTKYSKNRKFSANKVIGGILVGAGLLSTRGSVVNANRNIDKEILNEKAPVSLPLLDKDPFRVEEYSILDSSTSIGLGLDGEGHIKEDNTKEGIEEKDIIQEIKDIVHNINNQSLENRVDSKLTVDVGLIAFLSEEFPELAVPNLSFDQIKGDILIENQDIKFRTDGMNVKSLYEKFNLLGVNVNPDSVLVREGELGWNDKVLIYGGYIAPDFLQRGDVMSILDDDVISEGSEVVDDAVEIRFITVLDKQMSENGEYVLTVISTDEERRSIDMKEIEGDSLKNILEENVFVIRKDWGGIDSEIFNFTKWDSEYLLFDRRRDYHPTVPFYFVVGNQGAHLYSFELQEDGFINHEGQVSEILVPPGFIFDIKATISVLTPDGYHIQLGFPNIYGDPWLTRGNSVIIIMAEDLERNRVDFLDYVPNSTMDIEKFKERNRIGGGYMKEVLEDNWDTDGSFPFYVSKYSKVSEVYHFVKFCYDKEFLNGFRAYIEDNRFETISILKLGTTINEALIKPEIPLGTQLRESNWYEEYLEEMRQKGTLTIEKLTNLQKAIEYISYGEKTGVAELNFLIASNLLYPELSIQDIENYFISKQKEESKSFLLEEIISKEVLQNPDLLSFPNPHGGMIYRGIDSPEFLEIGDIIINLDKERIGFVVNKISFFDADYVIYAEANRYGDGRVFINYFYEEKGFQSVLGEGIYVLREND